MNDVTKGTNWSCPFCGKWQTLTSAQIAGLGDYAVNAKSKHGHIILDGVAVSCANPDCLEVTITLELWAGPIPANTNRPTQQTDLGTFRLRPRSSAQQWPSYIPAPIREDYEEACLILNDSAKAAATLCRRCLQGMIRDFCQITKGTLDQEIKALREAVDAGNASKGDGSHRRSSDSGQYRRAHGKGRELDCSSRSKRSANAGRPFRVTGKRMVRR